MSHNYIQKMVMYVQHYLPTACETMMTGFKINNFRTPN